VPARRSERPRSGSSADTMASAANRASARALAGPRTVAFHGDDPEDQHRQTAAKHERTEDAGKGQQQRHDGCLEGGCVQERRAPEEHLHVGTADQRFRHGLGLGEFLGRDVGVRGRDAAGLRPQTRVDAGGE